MLLQDLRFAFRQLKKNPGFGLTAVLMLALGLGASVAIFAFVDAALIEPLPYADPNRLVEVAESATLFPRSNISYPDYLDWKRMNTVFSSLDAYHQTHYLLRMAGQTESVPAGRVSDGFFRTLGIVPILGRDFFAGEDRPTAAEAVLLSYWTWQRRFKGRRDVIGETVSLSGMPATIIGVLPENFQFAPLGSPEVWASLQPTAECEKKRSCHDLYGVARLKDGVAITSALAEMKSIASQLERQYPDSNRGQGASVVPLYEAIVGDIRPILLALLGGAGLLLLIACVNVSSLLLARSESRRREIAVRGALGASASRLARQFVTEGLVLVGFASLLGIAAAQGAIATLLRLVSKDMMNEMPYLAGVALNGRVAVFTVGVSLLAAVLFSLTPILRVSATGMGAEMRSGLAEGGRGSSGAVWRRFGANLVVLELAIAMVLLAGAGLLGKSFYRLLHVDVNFQPDHLAVVEVQLPQADYAKDEARIRVHREILRQIARLPGVKSAGTTTVLPVSFNGNTDWIRFEGKPYNGIHNEVNERDVSAYYFSTLQAKLLRGRYFTDGEDASKPPVVIINRALAERYFPGEDPIGKRIGDIRLSPASMKTVIGIVDNIKEGALDETIWPAEYHPFNQDSAPYFDVVARTSQDAASVLPEMDAVTRKVDPAIGTIDEATMIEHINQSQTAYLHRSSAWLVGGFAILALLLGVVGLYGVIAYSVSQRTREIGVRMALGAQRASVYRMILTEAFHVTFFGIVAGLICSMGAATLMRSLLFGVRAWDISTLAVVAGVLGVSAMLASYLPARRAASVNPVEALRAE
ncbi:Macrolide-specific ABC-type efflux carrier [Acidisarcina polymorpha]|uniref:Macrolide-specific ABC-type efflux carrier n=1 Tax=Acidisarcina polymorpha TaxID=2211140 RepID=A0A2Z5FSP6_9BACT|nr:ABC transporter permease [Acidisarcina polymorpha]AXC09505.1 Macrolide-specific ABC-type efflux carrier [Acidisarcina polymorpha]